MGRGSGAVLCLEEVLSQRLHGRQPSDNYSLIPSKERTYFDIRSQGDKTHFAARGNSKSIKSTRSNNPVHRLPTRHVRLIHHTVLVPTYINGTLTPTILPTSMVPSPQLYYLHQWYPHPNYTTYINGTLTPTILPTSMVPSPQLYYLHQWYHHPNYTTYINGTLTPTILPTSMVPSPQLYYLHQWYPHPNYTTYINGTLTPTILPTSMVPSPQLYYLHQWYPHPNYTTYINGTTTPVT